MSTELQHLKKMANQIADNFRWHADSVERIADHIARFWAPSMREQLEAHARAGGGGLDDDVRAALEKLRAQGDG